MFKRVFLVSCIIILTGCGDHKLNKARSEYACENHGGVYKYGDWTWKTTCNDGSLKDISSVKILPEKYWLKGDSE